MSCTSAVTPRAAPTVELHVHLEGATDAETVWIMAERNGVSLPAQTLEAWRRHYAFRDFEHFIEVYTAATSAMRTPADWTFMVERFAAGQASQGVRYSEVFLSASLQLGRFDLDDWIEALVEGAVRAEAQHGTRVRFIPDIARHEPQTQEPVLDFLLRARATGYFVGLGLGGIEEGFPPALFVDTFQAAREAGLHVVAHAGETTGPETIWASLELLGAERIGHGIRCVDDPVLTKHLREQQIPMEVCPTSNYCLGVVAPGRPHPIRTMVDSGLCCTVNSDDPPMFGTTLADEVRLLEAQGFTAGECDTLFRNAAQAAFVGDDDRDALY